MVQIGTWVTVRRAVLAPEGRAAGIPEDTAKTPLLVWAKGELLQEAEIGGEARIRTRTGRIESGILEDVRPQYDLGYGDFIPELMRIGPQAREILSGGKGNE